MGRAPIKEMPSQAELQQLFSYIPETGILRWKTRMAGKEAGTIRQGRSGYLAVGITKRYYMAHRIIWKMVTGNEPASQIDHIDGNKLNNRWGNLREADHGQNKHNCGISRNNKSGVKGVCWDAYHNKWKAYIGVRGRQIRLGRFRSLDDAAMAISVARKRLHGEFARSI